MKQRYTLSTNFLSLYAFGRSEWNEAWNNYIAIEKRERGMRVTRGAVEEEHWIQNFPGSLPSHCLAPLLHFPFLSPASSTPNLSLPLLCSCSVAPTADSRNLRSRANCSSTPDPSPRPCRRETGSPLFPTTLARRSTGGA